MKKVNFSGNVEVNFDLVDESNLSFLTLHIDGNTYEFDLEKEYAIERVIASVTIGSYFNPEYALDYDIGYECIKDKVIPCIDELGNEFEIELDEKLFNLINSDIEEKAIDIFIKDMGN